MSLSPPCAGALACDMAHAPLCGSEDDAWGLFVGSRNEGVGGLYKGLVPNTLRVLPSSAITFMVYEAVNKWLS